MPLEPRWLDMPLPLRSDDALPVPLPLRSDDMLLPLPALGDVLPELLLPPLALGDDVLEPLLVEELLPLVLLPLVAPEDELLPERFMRSDAELLLPREELVSELAPVELPLFEPVSLPRVSEPDVLGL